MSAIWVWVEQHGGEAVPVSWEAIGAGRTVANELGVELAALVFGQEAATVAENAISYGADRVFLCEDDTLSDFRPDPFAAIVSKLATEDRPKAIIAGATSSGRDLLSLVAVDLDAGLVPDCTGLQVEDGEIKVTRPVYAGKLMSTIHVDGETLLFSLRSRAFPSIEPDQNRRGEIIKVDAVRAESEIPVKILGTEAAEGQVSLTDAGIIVSGGRGVGGPEGFEPVRVLAARLGAALGASRAAVDAGWIPYSHQVGQTGKTVSPDLYIACGISGAIQHLAGMRTAKIIVAINKDPEAPIFKIAQYGIVGDLFEYVPVITDQLEKQL